MKILQFGDDGDKVNNFDKFCFNRSNTQIFACSFVLQGLRGQRFGMSVPATEIKLDFLLLVILLNPLT